VQVKVRVRERRELAISCLLIYSSPCGRVGVGVEGRIVQVKVRVRERRELAIPCLLIFPSLITLRASRGRGRSRSRGKKKQGVSQSLSCFR